MGGAKMDGIPGGDSRAWRHRGQRLPRPLSPPLPLPPPLLRLRWLWRLPPLLGQGG